MKGDRRHFYLVGFQSFSNTGMHTMHTFGFVSNQNGCELAKEIQGRVASFKSKDFQIGENRVTTMIFDCGVTGRTH
jgi:hypothetical protein